MTTTITDTPRVWVGCLASYNNGDLYGEWVDATDSDDLNENIQRILAASPSPDAEEWFFADYDGFYGYRVGEYDSVEQVCKVGAAIEEHGEPLAAFLEAEHEVDDIGRFEDFYRGEWDSEQQFAEEQFEELTVEMFKGELRHQAPDLVSFFEQNIEPHLEVNEVDELMNYTTIQKAGGGIYVFADNA